MPSEVGARVAAEGREAQVTWMTGLWILLPVVGGFIWNIKTQGRLSEYWQAYKAAAWGALVRAARRGRRSTGR
jgi:hypothetical protein